MQHALLGPLLPQPPRGVTGLPGPGLTGQRGVTSPCPCGAEWLTLACACAGTSVMDALTKVLSLPAVHSKRFLTTKVDRCVTGWPQHYLSHSAAPSAAFSLPIPVFSLRLAGAVSYCLSLCSKQCTPLTKACGCTGTGYAATRLHFIVAPACLPSGWPGGTSKHQGMSQGAQSQNRRWLDVNGAPPGQSCSAS